MEKLKPCPFCGSERVKIVTGSSMLALKYQGMIRTVGCGECGANGGIYNTLALPVKVAEEKAVESWNKRSGEK